MYFRDPFNSELQFSVFSQRYRLLTVPLNALFAFASFLYSCVTFETLHYPSLDKEDIVSTLSNIFQCYFIVKSRSSFFFTCFFFEG